MKDFKNRVAVVTGAASGIGYAMASRFVDEGMKVVLADIETTPLLEAESTLRERGAVVLAVKTDVSKAESVEALKRKTLETFGAVHILCNNAGVSAPEGPLWKRTLSDWEWVLKVNLWGVIHGIHAFLPHMLASEAEGHIVNTASRDGFVAGPLMGIYRASKHAVVSLTESLYFELAIIKGRVKVSLLCPGTVQTRIRESERNRPVELADTSGCKSSAIKPGAKTRGILPCEVAERVIQGIRSEQFYIFTGTTEDKAYIQARSEWILAERNPTFLESRETRLRRMQLLRTH